MKRLTRIHEADSVARMEELRKEHGRLGADMLATAVNTAEYGHVRKRTEFEYIQGQVLDASHHYRKSAAWGLVNFATTSLGVALTFGLPGAWGLVGTVVCACGLACVRMDVRHWQRATASMRRVLEHEPLPPCYVWPDDEGVVAVYVMGEEE